eukprot:530118-Rhodomonas_salina.2
MPRQKKRNGRLTAVHMVTAFAVVNTCILCARTTVKVTARRPCATALCTGVDTCSRLGKQATAVCTQRVAMVATAMATAAAKSLLQTSVFDVTTATTPTLAAYSSAMMQNSMCHRNMLPSVRILPQDLASTGNTVSALKE